MEIFIILPIILMGFLAYSRLYDVLPAAERLNLGEESDTGFSTGQTGIGLVDEAGLIQTIPAALPDDLFIPFANKVEGLAALQAGDIEQVVVIDPDYIANGQVIIYDQNFQIRMNGEEMGVAFNGPHQGDLAALIDYNLVGSKQVFSQLANPIPADSLTPHILNPQPVDAVNSQEMARAVAAVMPYIFYFLLLMGGSYMMRAVVAEKESRTVELILLSVSPRHLMVGKLLAMSVIVLIQVAAWVGAGRFILGWGAEQLNMDLFAFPPGFFVWAALFLLFGFLLFASVMGAAGALANNPREGGQIMWLLIVPLMPTLMFSDILATEPNHPLTLFLSLFPLSAPNAMVTRLAVSEVPLWQTVISLVLLALTTYGLILFTSRLFRAGNLLSDATFSFKRLVTAWR